MQALRFGLKLVAPYGIDLTYTTILCYFLILILNQITLIQQTATSQTRTYGGGYIGNIYSKVFYYADCSSLSKMKDKNKVVLNSREEAINGVFRRVRSTFLLWLFPHRVFAYSAAQVQRIMFITPSIP